MKEKTRKLDNAFRLGLIGTYFTLVLSLLPGLPFANGAQSNDSKFSIIFDAVTATFNQGKVPVVISDLDETLVDSLVRRYYSLILAAGTLCGNVRTGDCGHLFGINFREVLELPNHYDTGTLLTKVGVTDKEFFKNVGTGLVENYLSGRLMEFDQAVAGSTEFVQKLNELHAKLFFVSSRYSDTQKNGTLESLKHLGFIPSDSIGETILLRTRGESSIDFKKGAFSFVQSWANENNGEVVLVMENEPENMNALTDAFPKAKSIFVDGAYLKDISLTGNPMRIKDFR